MERRSFFGGLAALFAAPFLTDVTQDEVIDLPKRIITPEPNWVKLTPMRGRVMTAHISHAKEQFPDIEFTGLPKYVKTENGLFRIEEEKNPSDKWVVIGFKS